MSPKKNVCLRVKKKENLKKAPGAPKRFKSSYILFFMHVQERIKKSLPLGTSSAPAVSKRASQMWKALPSKEREHWDNEAAKEKQRYLEEKEAYTGPWQVPNKRAKKDPSAPRRNPSAFLLFSIKKRKELKEQNPDLKNTEISRMLGEEWRKTSEQEKHPFIQQEESERELYKLRMAEWKKEKEVKDKAVELEKKQKAAELRALSASKILSKDESLLEDVHINAMLQSQNTYNTSCLPRTTGATPFNLESISSEWWNREDMDEQYDSTYLHPRVQQPSISCSNITINPFEPESHPCTRLSHTPPRQTTTHQIPHDLSYDNCDFDLNNSKLVELYPTPIESPSGVCDWFNVPTNQLSNMPNTVSTDTLLSSYDPPSGSCAPLPIIASSRNELISDSYQFKEFDVDLYEDFSFGGGTLDHGVEGSFDEFDPVPAKISAMRQIVN